MKKQIVSGMLALSILAGATGANAEIKMFNEPPFEAYKVSQGDSFYFIAKRYGLDYKKLMELNPKVDPMNMQVGSIIRLKAPSTVAAQPSNQAAAYTVSAYEKEVLTLVNQERAKVGLPALKLNTELSRVARIKSQDMQKNKYFSHQSPTYGSPFDMMKSFGIKYSYAGENIAYGQKTPQEVMKAWMNSSGHKANILSKNFTEIGIGHEANGNYWTQQFIKPQ